VNDSVDKTPIILGDTTTFEAYSLFNPNDWQGRSKPIVGSCATQYGLLLHIDQTLKGLFEKSESLCEKRFETLQQQWAKHPWNFSDCDYFVEISALHLSIQGFLSAGKTFLDLLVQLVGSEGIVSSQVNGFHKRNDEVGGKLINTLANNAVKGQIASDLSQLITQHKPKWIDRLVRTRDFLIHPRRGLSTVVLMLVVEVEEKQLRLKKIQKPSVDGQEFDVYVAETVKNIAGFSAEFLRLIKS